jgi:hypothetical protein
VLEGTREWCKGRRGELLTTAVWAGYHFLVHDLSSMNHAGAPRLQQATETFRAPDHLLIRNVTFYVDSKTKSAAFNWKGGGPDHSDRQMPRGPAHGIDARAWGEYWRTQEASGVPVVIVVLDIAGAVMLANSLRQLGEPYPSVNPQFKMVNWPVSKFNVVTRFNPKGIGRYFYMDPDNPIERTRTVRPPPAGMPDPRAMQRWLDQLRPEQEEFSYFREIIIRELERKFGQ